MKTKAINWSNISIAQAASVFEESFKGRVQILPTKEIFNALQKECKEGLEISLHLAEDDEDYELTTYCYFNSLGNMITAEVDATDGITAFGCPAKEKKELIMQTIEL